MLNLKDVSSPGFWALTAVLSDWHPILKLHLMTNYNLESLCSSSDHLQPCLFHIKKESTNSHCRLFHPFGSHSTHPNQSCENDDWKKSARRVRKREHPDTMQAIP